MSIPAPALFADVSSGLEILVLGAVILASTAAYLVWLAKRKL